LNACYDFYSDPDGVRRKEAGSKYDLPEEERLRKCLDFVQHKIDSSVDVDEMIKSLGVHEHRLEMTSANVPESTRLDRLLKYGASLERDFDRTLNQLERRQRVRTGQPIPPQFNVNI
jgi:hypothetical protein